MDVPHHINLEAEVQELFATKMREFAAFCAEHWTMTKAEAETLTKPVVAPQHWAEGYTYAMQEGIKDALEFWLDEECGYGR